MNCHDAREYFSDWADEALTAEERTALAAHLAQCLDCRRELDRFQATVRLLQRVEPPRAPAGFVDRVIVRTRPTSWRRRLLQRLFFPLPVKLPAEAAALLLVAGLAVFVVHRTPELRQAARPPEVSQPAARLDAPAAPAPAEEPASPDALARREFEAAKLQGRVQPEQHALKLPASPPPSSSASPPGSSLASPPTPQEMAKTGALSAPPSPDAPRSAAVPFTAAAPPPAPGIERKKEMRDEGASGPRASEPAPTPPGPAPTVEGRADSATQRLQRAPSSLTSRSEMRVLPPADVVGSLTVRDRDVALRALVELLVRARGAETSRRVESGATVVDLVVPATSYAEFSRELARIGVWLPQAEPSELPAHVRVTLRLTE